MDKFENKYHIRIRVIRSNRKTISLQLRGNDVLEIKIPQTYSDDELEEFMVRHSRWIERRLSARAQRFAISLEDGAQLTLFDEEYRVCSGKPAWGDGVMLLPQERREEHFRRLLKFRVREETLILVRDFSAKYGFHFKDVLISSAKKRWASCNAEGVLRFSFCTAFLPVELAEYLVVHELCHTRHMDHSAAFWQEVKKILPDWRRRRAALRTYEWVMECF